MELKTTIISLIVSLLVVTLYHFWTRPEIYVVDVAPTLSTIKQKFMRGEITEAEAKKYIASLEKNLNNYAHPKYFPFKTIVIFPKKVLLAGGQDLKLHLKSNNSAPKKEKKHGKK